MEHISCPLLTIDMNGHEWSSSWAIFKITASLYAITSVSFPLILHIFPNTCNTILQSSHVYTQQWLRIKAAYPTPLSTQDTNTDVYSVHSHKPLHVLHCNTENFWNVPCVQTVKKNCNTQINLDICDIMI